MTTEDDEDDEIFDLARTIGAGVEASRDESLPPVERDFAKLVTEQAAAKLADLNRSGTVGDD
ncbi:hypothetical protein [Streptomyces acidiscabies]|uniref:Uncharacterized protein n=1 Tax=Streptomyces acidiscabies TaxID=42234 RepID=A0A0L0K2U4_9ACTN|nr:hypothetical protein [Streptomyces acidiscabies]KND32133.1 hypothetical protein IQ63_24195 [Streptomyces acidiscabies]